MPEYFVLRSIPSVEMEGVEGYMEIEDWDATDGFEDWGWGTAAQRRPTGPVVIQAVPHDGYKGLPDDLQDTNVPLMSKRLKTAIEAAGVDNINFLPVTLRNSETGETYEYFAFNLVGLVAAADPARSQMASHDGDFIGDSQVHTLALDDARTRGHLMFRLKEKFSVILVHEVVRKAIEQAGIDTVRFIKPEDFMAL